MQDCDDVRTKTRRLSETRTSHCPLMIVWAGGFEFDWCRSERQCLAATAAAAAAAALGSEGTAHSRVLGRLLVQHGAVQYLRTPTVYITPFLKTPHPRPSLDTAAPRARPLGTPGRC